MAGQNGLRRAGKVDDKEYFLKSITMAIIGLPEYMRYLHLPSVVDTYMYTTCSKITMAFKRNLTCIWKIEIKWL